MKRDEQEPTPAVTERLSGIRSHAHDDADRAAGRRITCPVLMLWSSEDDLEDLYGDVLAVWRPWTTDLRGHAIKSGHHMAEDNPEALATALGEFFGGV